MNLELGRTEPLCFFLCEFYQLLGFACEFVHYLPHNPTEHFFLLRISLDVKFCADLTNR